MPRIVNGEIVHDGDGGGRRTAGGRASASGSAGGAAGGAAGGSAGGSAGRRRGVHGPGRQEAGAAVPPRRQLGGFDWSAPAVDTRPNPHGLFGWPDVVVFGVAVEARWCALLAAAVAVAGPRALLAGALLLMVTASNNVGVGSGNGTHAAGTEAGAAPAAGRRVQAGAAERAFLSNYLRRAERGGDGSSDGSSGAAGGDRRAGGSTFAPGRGRRLNE